ncbi:MAG: phenylalanine--tRNA ligase subunit alpha [Candidatus Saccharimonadales bacterium]
MQDIAKVAAKLKKQFETLEQKRDVLKAPELKNLYAQIPKLPVEERKEFGQAINDLKQELEALVEGYEVAQESEAITPIDVTAPFDVNVAPADRPKLLDASKGSAHPLMTELDIMLNIFYRMGFAAVESRQIDDDYHMFSSLNFPEGHPARDDFDTFTLAETDANDVPFVAPAHTSTMQNRVLKAGKKQLEAGKPIAVVVPGRVFRNEDVDARHEHTFYQLEGIYVDKGVNAGHLIATLKAFMQEYYQKELDVKTQPFYFPFTEPSFEFAQSCPFCDKKGCHVCSYSGWIELLGCGMIHPNVLKMAGIDPTEYTGFAWGVGFMRMVMIKYGIEDIRHFESGKLEFLRQFA